MRKMHIRKVREGKIDVLRKWGKTLSTDRRDEAVYSLTTENVAREFSFIALINGDYYFIGYMEANGEIFPANIELPINKDHVAVMRECLEEPSLGEELYNLHA